MRVRSSGRKARPPGFNSSSVFWSHVTLEKCQNCSVHVFPAVKWGNDRKGTFLIRWLNSSNEVKPGAGPLDPRFIALEKIRS